MIIYCIPVIVVTYSPSKSRLQCQLRGQFVPPECVEVVTTTSLALLLLSSESGYLHNLQSGVCYGSKIDWLSITYDTASPTVILRLITIWLDEISRIHSSQRPQVVSNSIEVVVRLIRARLGNLKIRDLQMKGSHGFVQNATIQGLGLCQEKLRSVGMLLVTLHYSKTFPGSSIPNTYMLPLSNVGGLKL